MLSFVTLIVSFKARNRRTHDERDQTVHCPCGRYAILGTNCITNNTVTEDN